MWKWLCALINGKVCMYVMNVYVNIWLVVGVCE